MCVMYMCVCAYGTSMVTGEKGHIHTILVKVTKQLASLCSASILKIGYGFSCPVFCLTGRTSQTVTPPPLRFKTIHILIGSSNGSAAWESLIMAWLGGPTFLLICDYPASVSGGILTSEHNLNNTKALS